MHGTNTTQARGMNKHALDEGIRQLSPAYFALPMSTGIIALASHDLGHDRAALLFFAFNIIELAILAVLLLLRVLLHFRELRSDLARHSKGAGFLTVVAALCVLGTEHLLLRHDHRTALSLQVLASVAWVVFTYSFFILVTVRRRKPSLEAGLNGSWLLFVVSVEALSILGCLLAPGLGMPEHIPLFIALFFFLLGILFYLVVIGLIFYRTTFFPMHGKDFKPSYWIDMGAAAITALAGTTLVQGMAHLAVYRDFIPTLKVLSVFAWIAGSWWIPVVLVLEIRRHLTTPLRYQADYWSMVFPLGMYTAATWDMAEVLGFGFLSFIPRVFIWIAWLAWTITFVAMCRRIVRAYLL
jgi:tellurite resistance protein TehA-like permease